MSKKSIVINPIYVRPAKCLFIVDRSCGWFNQQPKLAIGISTYRAMIHHYNTDNMQGLRICLKKKL